MKEIKIVDLTMLFYIAHSWTKTYSHETNQTGVTYPLTPEGGQGREIDQNSDNTIYTIN